MATKHNGVWHQVSEEAPHPQHPHHALQLLDIRGDKLITQLVPWCADLLFRGIIQVI